MKTPIAVRLNNRLFNTLLIFSGITFMLVWLPLLRCLFDGNLIVGDKVISDFLLEVLVLSQITLF